MPPSTNKQLFAHRFDFTKTVTTNTVIGTVLGLQGNCYLVGMYVKNNGGTNALTDFALDITPDASAETPVWVELISGAGWNTGNAFVVNKTARIDTLGTEADEYVVVNIGPADGIRLRASSTTTSVTAKGWVYR